ncbi:MAG: cytochrome b N-terminal domain-containing protein [Vicinamibacterales bacterium]
MARDVFIRIGNWLENRAGWRAARRHLLDEPLPAGTGWWFTLGSVLLAALALQAVTGVLLSLTYAPTPDHAHESVRYIDQSIRAGAFLRGLHYYGATIIVIAAALHVVRVVVFGAYRKPRELTWLTGLALLLVILAFALTGYLLPWDQRAYWATVVTINIAALTPVVGELVAGIMRGGPEIGALTLTRWYAAHVIVLPAILVLLVALHLYLMRRHGISGPWGRKGDGSELFPRSHRIIQTRPPFFPFYPYQAARDVTAALIVIAILIALASRGAPPLEPVADPAEAGYMPRPEWYFLGLFQLLKYFPGRLEVVGAIVIPGLVLLLLALLPWIDRGPSRDPAERRLPLAIFGVIALSLGALTAAGWRDRPPPADSEWTIREVGGAAMASDVACTRCHADGGVADPVGPGTITRDAAWIEGHLFDPEMIAPGLREPPESNEREIEALLAFLARARRGDRPPPLAHADVTAMRVFARFCIGCHRIEKGGRDGGDEGPDLSNIGQKHDPAALRRWIADPEAVNADAEMPAFGTRLSEDEMTTLVEWLGGQRAAPNDGRE